MKKISKANFRQLMDEGDNIRNIAVMSLGDKDQGVCNITQQLVTAHGIVALEVAGGVKMVDANEHEGAATSTGISLLYEPKPPVAIKGKQDADKFLLNLFESCGELGPDSFSHLRISDGALIIAGLEFSDLAETAIQQALSERVIPVLALNDMNRCFLDYNASGETVYQNLSSVIEDANAIIESHEDQFLGDFRLCPGKGNVAFSAGLHGWGFTLRNFARIYSKITKMTESQLMGKLWGGNFYDFQLNEWTTEDTGSRSCKRGFVQYVYEPIKQIIGYCMKNQKERLLRNLMKVSVTLTAEEKSLEGVDLMACVMQAWLPLSSNLLEMMVDDLPSPLKAQKYRVGKLYSGPSDDVYASAIRDCDPEGPVVVYICKMISTRNRGRFFAFGRVFAGKVASGKQIRIMGPNYVHGKDKDYHSAVVPPTLVVMGKSWKSVNDVPCGNTIIIAGLDRFLKAKSTIIKHGSDDCFPIISRHSDIKVERHTESATAVDQNFRLLPQGSIREPNELPYKVHQELLPHQRESLTWFWKHHCNGTGGILADDMGMGKTREVSAFLCGLFHCGLIKSAIIVVPVSLVNGWVFELRVVALEKLTKTFVNPDIKSKMHILKEARKDGGILITTYDVFRLYSVEIMGKGGKFHWDYIFLDEGHKIKNLKTKISEVMNKVKCRRRFVVSGTPYQNNMEEFFAIVNFSCPGLLGDQEHFDNEFAYPIDKGKYKNATCDEKGLAMEAYEKLKKQVDPFVLRRTKNLLREQKLLREKQEFAVWLKLTPYQNNLYKALVTQDRGNNARKSGLAEAQVARDICNHPLILADTKTEEGMARSFSERLLKIVPRNDDLIKASCKISFVVFLVEKLRGQNLKILIFSQYRLMLDILEEALSALMKDGNIIKMDGETKAEERFRLVKAFQENASFVEGPQIFLMTTRVGGLGLNLTAASRVIIVDPSYNPSTDSQTVDRVYRIGQTKNVVIYRLLTCGTIEEHTYRQQVLKGETSTSITEKKQCKRGIHDKDGNVLVYRRKAFAVSETHRELVKLYGDEFDEDMMADLELVKKHALVQSVTNHSRLFLIEEDFYPSPSDDASCRIRKVQQKRRSYRKYGSDVVVDRAHLALEPRDERWRNRNVTRAHGLTDKISSLKK